MSKHCHSHYDQCGSGADRCRYPDSFGHDNRQFAELCRGSGGVVVPYLGKKMNVQWKIVKKAPIISTIGVAMAMVREVVERTVTNPTEGDMKAIRHEALEQVMKSGAAEATVEIAIEYDKKTNIRWL